MASVDVFGDLLSDDLPVCFQRMGKFLAVFGRHFIADMDQLPEIRVIVGVAGDMAKRIRQFCAAPTLYLFGRGQPLPVNINYRSIRAAQLVEPCQGAAVDTLARLAAFVSPESASPVISSSHVVPAVLMWIPLLYLRISLPITG